MPPGGPHHYSHFHSNAYENHHQIPSKNAQIKRSTIESLVSSIPVPEIKLLAEDVSNKADIGDVLETFNCMICYSIPIEPMECNKCDVLFCTKCINKYK
jgi:hypothetical protein